MQNIVISILVAGLGALVTFVGRWSAHAVRDRRLNRQYPIAGRFVTEYDDDVDGVRVLMKGLTTFTQRGREVLGETVEFTGGRSWTLSGRLERVTIRSTEESKEADTASDGVRQCVRRATAEDARRVCSLLGEALGERYIELEALRRLIVDEARSACSIAEAQNGHLIGALTVGVVENHERGASLPLGQAELVEHLRVTRFNEVDDFWLKDSRAQGYDCPSCGGECHCSAVIFTRNLDAAEVPSRSTRSPRDLRYPRRSQDPHPQ